MKIQEYLQKTNQRAYQFADKIGVAPSTIYRAMKGAGVHGRSARLIVEGSGNKITYKDLLPELELEAQNA